MRIALASNDYPPVSTEGIARQRQVLAAGLARLGHDVHVVTLGTRQDVTVCDGVAVHRYDRNNAVNEYLPSLPVLNRPLSEAQLLCEAVQDVAKRVQLDIVDVPLWLAQPLALIRQPPCPVVVWLQTTLLHLVELQDRAPREHERILADIDRFCLGRADGCIADSQSVLDDIVRLYTLPALRHRTTTVYPGLASVPRQVRSPHRTRVRALVVGRLEQRKGTPFLLEVLPQLLHELPELQVTFMGRDNSPSDGFERDTGLTYPQAFRNKHPELASRVRFEGYVDDATLHAGHESADLLIHPARYESFGLIFLEGHAGCPPNGRVWDRWRRRGLCARRARRRAALRARRSRGVPRRRLNTGQRPGPPRQDRRSSTYAVRNAVL